MPLVEELFWHDSVATCSLVSELDGERWLFALAGIAGLLADAGVTGDDAVKWMTSQSSGFLDEFGIDPAKLRKIGKRYRRHSAAVRAILEGDQTVLPPAVSRALAVRHSRSSKVWDKLHALSASGELLRPVREILRGVVHMHTNRVLPSKARANETVLYDFLRRGYQTRVAMSRAN